MPDHGESLVALGGPADGMMLPYYGRNRYVVDFAPRFGVIPHPLMEWIDGEESEPYGHYTLMIAESVGQPFHRAAWVYDGLTEEGKASLLLGDWMHD